MQSSHVSLCALDDTAAARRGSEALLIFIAVVLVAVAVLRSEPLQSANDRSRWATVWSLVERGTYRIDEIDEQRRWSTIDKVRVGETSVGPWHFYSSKPPLLSTLVAGLYAVERHTLGFALFNDTVIVSRLLLLIVNVIPFWLSLCSLRRCLHLLDASSRASLFVLAVAGFGSLLNPYLTTLNNHTSAAAVVMLAIEAAVRILKSRGVSDESTSVIAYLALGFFAALAACFELPAALLGIAAFCLALWCSPRRTMTWFVPAAALPLVAFFVTNWVATGGLRPFYAGYGSETYVYVHNGVASYWSNPRDLDANTERWPAYLFHCVLGHHGLISLMPVLLLSIVGTVAGLLRPRGNGLRVVIIAGVALTVVTLGFYLTRTENYNYGGNSFALRWMLWLSPFWWLAMVPAIERCQCRWRTLVATALLAASIGTVTWSLNRPWKPSWIFERMEAAGWINYRTPR